MDIPQKNYDVLSNRQTYRKSRISLSVIFLTVSGIIVAAFSIANAYTRTGTNRQPGKPTARPTPERKPVKIAVAENDTPIASDEIPISESFA